MEKHAIIILAAGQGKRMGSDTPKVLTQTISGNTLIGHVLDTATKLSPEKIVIVTGYKRELVEESIAENYKGGDIESIAFAHQKEQKGTGDAVKAGLEELKSFTGNVLILYGDVPLIKIETIEKLFTIHKEENATVSLLSATTDSPASYGRIIRDEEGHITCIREAKDCSPKEYLIPEINTGIYLVDSAFLLPAVTELETDNAQGEYYLTDIIEKAATEGQTVACHILSQIIEAQGVNNSYDLLLLNDELRRRSVEKLTTEGVTFFDARSFFADTETAVAKGVRVGPNVQLLEKCIVEEDVIFEGDVWAKNCHFKKRAHIKTGLRAEDAVIGENASIGPFAHLRPGTTIEADVKIGNFVETKKAHIQKGAKVPHLSYVGDAEVGQSANVGAGTITCNYDGFKKSKTIIGEGAFIGSNSSLVAPVTIGAGATVGAGSTITKEVSQDALAITRADQREIKDWSRKKREKNAQ